MRNAPDKNPFKGISDLLSRAAPAKRTLHFLAYVIDFLIVGVVSYLLFLGGHAIVRNTSDYKTSYSNYEAEITYYQDMIVDAHVAEYLDRDNNIIADDENLTVKMAISQILLSYSHDNVESPEFGENPLTKLKKQYPGSFYSDCFTEASFDNDYVSRFFIEYVPAHNENNELVDFDGKDPVAYTVSYYKERASKYGNIKFIFSSDNSSIPYLKTSVANELYEYLIRAENYDRTAYDSFVNFYTSMLNHCEDLIFNAESYQNGHYKDYLAYRQNVIVATDVTLIISIILGYYIAVFLPQMIFKDGRSLGRIFMRTASINTDKSETELWKNILRSILGAISSLYIAFFLALLPPFNGASMILYLPFISLGTLDITLLNIIIIIFTLTASNGIFMLFTHEKRSLTDLIFKTVTVDITLLDEPDYDEKDEASR